MRAAIAQQEAHGYALDGDEKMTQRLLDESHRWATTDTIGDARQGHGSFCTASYIEIQRAACFELPDGVRLVEVTKLPGWVRLQGAAQSRFGWS